MPYKVATTSTFMSDFISAPRTIQNKYDEVVKDLRNAPDKQEGKKKKLRGCNFWRYRLNKPEYRIIYRVDQKKNSVELLMMGPRKDDKIYKRLRYVPESGLDTVTQEVLPAVEPEYILENPEVSRQPAPAANAKQLPHMTRERLAEWKVDKRYHARVLECRTEDELLNAVIPQHTKLRVMDCLWPKPIEQVVTQPTYVADSEEDLAKVADGKMSRLLLNLDREQLVAVERSLKWPIIIKGGPGSGKSVVALYKIASILNDPQQDWIETDAPTILFTTYTNSLVGVSKELLETQLSVLRAFDTVNRWGERS